ncbi:MAG: discoidin domain-containing protein [Candidatus Omnitrophota bacterium]
MNDIHKTQNSGSALVTVFIFSIVLSGLVVAYLDMVGILHQETLHKKNRYRVINMAEAGVNKMAAYLSGTAPDLSTNGSWRGTVTQTEAGQSYTAAVGDLLLEGPAISATSSSGANTPWSVMDGSANTYWLSSGSVPQTLTWSLATSGQWTIYVCRTRMLMGSGNQAKFPKDYTWQISTDGLTWTTVVTKTGNTNTDVTDTFTLQQANYIRLNVTQTQWASTPVVNIAEVEIFGVVGPPLSVTASSVSGANSAWSAVDNNLATGWSSSGAAPQIWTLKFPTDSNYSVGKINMRATTGATSQFPSNYVWSVSTNAGCTTWATVVNQTGNTSTNVTHTFALRSNVNCMAIYVSTVQAGGTNVGLGEVSIPGVCLSANSAVSYPGSRSLSYYTAQNAIVVDGSPPTVSRQPKGSFGVESGS